MSQWAICVPVWRFLYHVITNLQRAHCQLDLAQVSISRGYIDNKKMKSHWTNLRILNISKLVNTPEFEVTTAFSNLLEHKVSESKFNDKHLMEVSKMCNMLQMLIVSGCDITDFGIENTSLESLIFINISNCKNVDRAINMPHY